METEPAASQRGLLEQFDGLEDRSPSAKLVAKTLQYHGDMTLQPLLEKSRLHEPSARRAIEELEEIGVVERRPYLGGDARRSMLSLNDEQE